MNANDKKLAIGAGIIIAVLLFSSDASASSEGKVNDKTGDPKLNRLRSIVADEARRQGVPLDVAFALVETENAEWNPNAEADLAWPTLQDGLLYKKFVLNAPRFAKNPYRTDTKLWHSYGLFQLMAPYFSGDLEHPRKLLEPALNAERGLRYLKQKHTKHGDWTKAAMAYHSENSVTDPTVRDRQREARFLAAQKRYQQIFKKAGIQ